MSENERNFQQQTSTNYSIRAILGLEDAGDAVTNDVVQSQVDSQDESGMKFCNKYFSKPH